MYCWASASLFRSLKIRVDKQDNTSVVINNNPRDVVLILVLYNCDASNLKLVFVFEVSLVKLHPRIVIMTSECNHSSFIMSSMESILGLGFEPSCLTWESYLF